MTASKDSTRYIGNSLNVLSKLVEADTEISTIDLNIIENLNTNQSLNYIKLEQKLNNLEDNANSLEGLNNEFKSFNTTLLEIENQINKIEIITKELDGLSIELSSKVKKL
ncbi:DEHA2D18656p [Debaryomyces hansenii CBS767]|uniref:DEHA2D18656p n=1 Tax=Debaryomyces hansenii (strain ATCC 36239 / CBS 767 / BCRC 21394 / JCM 1990 / NBRC 0083 / IGC 2968) TaxID=284592 RepID=Q6BR74_DEBHA|nr:DEHA2D18656p [Debaryomyces hansenii CBS767]CAG87470.2 DEHA2D18656p [Debaryomyces hansenii CBS767]|eukprot:XP_459296.2 DEHA2D18656p [Debaryomyces hansenii CBS767]